MEEESFYGITLDKKGACVTWDLEENEEPNVKLLIKQILLGNTAKEGEFNVVEVETMSREDTVKIPIAVLKAGETRSVKTSFDFPNAPVIFKLIEGNGPVYIHGNQTPVYMENVEEEAQEDPEDEEEVVLEEEDEPPSKKKNGSENGSTAANGNKSNNPKSEPKSNKRTLKLAAKS